MGNARSSQGKTKLILFTSLLEQNKDRQISYSSQRHSNGVTLKSNFIVMYPR